MRYLGIDYGTKRVGLSVSDEAGRLAFPYAVIESGKNLVQKIIEIVKKEQIGLVVLGESLDYKNEPNPVMKKIQSLKEALLKEGIETAYEKEFLTTAAAERTQGKQEGIDASAAALILQSYLDRRNAA